ncbi:MAG: phosphoenolpyruvate carboxykinase (ATP), partial [Sulfurimonas sp.]|nr:phosphoenolpyruvate carboxykinase (ATP) [Sulfurimonas sp.]
MNLTELEEIGLKNVGNVYHNLGYEELIQHEIDNDECAVTKFGATAVDTGIFTGRSPKDKYFVDCDPSNKYIAWGDVNKKVSADIFAELLVVAQEQLSNKDLYITDVFCGSSAASKRSVRFVSEIAWQSHFVKNMFIRPTNSELEVFKSDFTVLNACKAVNDKWEEHGLNSEVFVLFDVENNMAIIGGTWYGGEMKKGIFSMMNYWLPLEGKLAMHCSANVGEKGDTALFFGLSGTGKTTLST